jgi:tyrosyl-tRNA synthetase
VTVKEGDMDKVITDPKKIDELLNRGTIVEIFPTKGEFREKLLSGKRLRLYIGIDATAPTLHLSHAKNFMLMEKFRKLGHEVIILFGDFTARIGDPSGSVSTRRQLTREEVLYNVKKWTKLASPLIDFKDKTNPAKIMYNHDWLSKLNFEEVINLASNFTVQQIIERDLFQKRLKENKPIYLHEFLYPIMQGYDSVAMEVDVEVCGTDQIFNALAGRTLLKKLKNKEKFVVAVTLMENPKTGELMSKSNGTGVFLDVLPSDLYGQIMSQPDEMIEILYINATLLTLSEIEKIMGGNNPRDAKARLAYEVTKLIHGEVEAKAAGQAFERQFVKNDLPEDIREFQIIDKNWSLADLMNFTELTSSKTEARRLVEQGGVKVDGAVIGDREAIIRPEENMIIQVGKRKFIKIKLDK